MFYHFREALPPGTPPWVERAAAQGYLAVDLFFILSGFVMALTYGEVLRLPSLPAARHFMALRLARIYPLHLVMLLLFLLDPVAIALFSHAGPIGEGYRPSYFLLSLFLVQNWGFTDVLDWNVPAWSISSEFFAYLLFPLLAMALPRIAGHAQRALCVAALLLAALAGLCALSGATLNDDIQHLGLPRCVLEFAAGMCLFALHRQRGALGRFVWRFLSWGAFLLALGCFAAYENGLLPDYALMPPGMFALLLAFSDVRFPPARALCARWLIWLGEVSYATYMVHFFIKIWIKFLLVRAPVPDFVPFSVYIVAILGASWALHVTVERWGRRLLRHKPRGI